MGDILGDLFARDLILGLAFLQIGRGTSLVQRLAGPIIDPADVIEAFAIVGLGGDAVLVEVAVHVALGINFLAGGIHEDVEVAMLAEGAAGPRTKEFRAGDVFDVEFDADILHHLHQQLLTFFPQLVARGGLDLETQGRALLRVFASMAFPDAVAILIHESGLIQQFPSLVRIEFRRRDVAFGPTDAQLAGAHGGGAIQEFIHDELLVDAVLDGLAHPQVGQQGMGVIQRIVGGVQGGVGQVE